MSRRGRFVALLMAFTVMGCKSAHPIATTGDGAAAAIEASPVESVATTVSSSSKVEYIDDPSLGNMHAISVTFPAKWSLQSIFLQGGTCAPTPFGVYRASSPDGQTMVEHMPLLAWQWGQGPMIGYAKKEDCLPVQRKLSAQDFLLYLAGTMDLHYDGPAAVPAAEDAKAQQDFNNAQAALAPQYAAAHLTPPKQDRQLARAMVSYNKGATAMKGLLDTMVDCRETTYAGAPGLSAGSPGHPPQMIHGANSIVDKCVASVTYFTAPAAQLAGVVGHWDSAGLGSEQLKPWAQAWINRNNQETQQALHDIDQAGLRQRQANAQMFAHSMAVQQQMHNQFMNTMQEGHEQFMAQQQASMNARSTATSDWVDYALDRQTVLNPNTGMIYKVTNQVTVEQPLQKVHGDGTPY